jgi:hypothetical protein
MGWPREASFILPKIIFDQMVDGYTADQVAPKKTATKK